ncbi:myotubularin-related protein 3-like isoform X1 [Myxocyprinus asiaticus]|uniref:myotubularin-related protein 3-like isoform X1 n=1 Tax=Myxocyprinus asiaticus TaxID=70543 RepID=UPI0022215C0D|nr:myotubularin-related protein 3-like isoform X1 [Myxocyprinus asiaticus]XP_051508554.1 myotubularin-related protein 3-like isoform X1 [Myxocyprinus asiaticus]
MEVEGQQSLECIQANQIFPWKPPVLEEEDLQVPFPELHGECTKYVGRAEDAIIAMSSYRLHIKFKESVVNVPLQLIESVECRDMFQLLITCKDCKIVRCQFYTFEQCQEWLKRLSAAVRPPSRIEELFSFAFHAWCVNLYTGEKEHHGDLCRPGDHVISRFHNEVERMGFDTQNAWRVTEINSKHRLCSSYPQLLLVPAWITDKELENVAAFRSWKRIPAVVYRHQSTGAVIARCGQPEVSWWGWRNADDEHLVQSIARACAVDSSSCKGVPNGSLSREYTNGADLSDVDFDSSMTNSSEVESLAIQPRKLLILDARSYAAAVANRAKGGGCECPEYYPNCEVVFMGMANIHSIRKSFQSLRFLCTQMPDPANWLSALESTKWLQHLSLLLKASLLVVNAVDRDHRPVLVHCSDGWDRTPQIVALAKLMLDPCYRTIEGFQVLVETEWLDFGHKFADRCGHGENAEDLNERCPVFLQWLDCVHQLQRQFPCSFEFNEAFLVKLVQHTYSCLFGTFLCNSGKEREDRHIQERTCSVWSLLRTANRSFRNMLYSVHSETVLHPVCHVRNLMLWTAVYLPSSSPTTPSDDSCAPYPAPGANPEDQPLGRRPKTRSFDNLPSACEVGNPLTSNRRSSDPSLNEKWQDPRRSLELNIGNGLDGAVSSDPEGRVNEQMGSGLMGTLPIGCTEERDGFGDVRLPMMEGVDEAELSLTVGVAMGQMENILQEATKEESAPDSRRDAKPDHTNYTSAPNCESNKIAHSAGIESNGISGKIETPLTVNAHESKAENLGDREVNGHFSEDGSSEESSALSQDTSVSQDSEELAEEALEKCALQEPNPSHKMLNFTPNGLQTLSYSYEVENPPGQGQTSTLAPETRSESLEQAEKRLSLLESSTETLTEDLGVQLESLGPLIIPPPLKTLAESSCLKQGLKAHPQGTPRTLNNTPKRPSLSAFPPSTDLLHLVCNGESPEPEPTTPQWARTNGERATLSRQVSLASCGSLTLHARGNCSHHRCLHLGFLGRPSFSPPEPPSSRSHLDDDGLTLHTDAVQQRLRQIEAGHQLEVEALKRQVQELWSRLESHQATGMLRLNGDIGDEVTSITDSDFNLEPNCLSRCSTELFSEASWEQVDKQDTEVTRWYPDHLAAQCYGCERGFWLATRKHHCRGKERMEEVWSCGNVFCASCCDQTIPVPSQQLFEPTRVCKSCFSSLHAPASALDIELDKPITASSN